MELWDFIPTTKVTESCEWETDVIRCKAGETRAAVRQFPRREFQFRYVLTPALYSRAATLAKALNADDFRLPLWTERARAESTSIDDEEIVPIDALKVSEGDAIYIQSAEGAESAVISEIFEDSIALTSALTMAHTNPLIMPIVRASIVQEFGTERGAQEMVTCSARFRTLYGYDYEIDAETLGYPTFEGRPFVIDRSVVFSSVQEAFTRVVTELDAGTNEPVRSVAYATPEQQTTLGFRPTTKAQLNKVLSWIYARKGQRGSFLVPSWNKDITLSANILATDTTITVLDGSYRTRKAFPFVVAVLLSSGSIVLAKVVSAALGTGGNEVLTLSNQFGQAVSVSNVQGVMLVTPYRFAADRIEIKHAIAQSASILIPLTEVPE